MWDFYNNLLEVRRAVIIEMFISYKSFIEKLRSIFREVDKAINII